MKISLLITALLLTTTSFAQSQIGCANVAGVYEYKSMSSQCSMKYATSPNNYFEGQDSAANWACDLSWIDAPSAGDAFIIKNNSKIIVEQLGCDNVKMILESISGKHFACEFKAGDACTTADYFVTTNLNDRSVCSREVPRNVNDYNGAFLEKCSSTQCNSSLAFSTLQVKRFSVTPWLGDQKVKLIQCAFPVAL